MKFKKRNLRALAEMIIGDVDHFPRRSSSFITEFFEDCGLDFIHDGSTRWWWTSERLSELLAEPAPANMLPERFVIVLRTLMDKGEAQDGDPERDAALTALNKPLISEGFEAFYGEDRQLHLRHLGTRTTSVAVNPHRPFSPDEVKRRVDLTDYLKGCSEDELIEAILVPLFRHLGFQRVTAAGHKDKALEYGKDVWMRFMLPTMNFLYFGLQVKKGKLDSAGRSDANVAEILAQTEMMLGHEIFDPEVNRRVLVDHAYIVAGGEITKAARNWLGNRLDQVKRSQIMFLDRDDLLNLYTASRLPVPQQVNSDGWLDDSIPF